MTEQPTPAPLPPLPPQPPRAYAPRPARTPWRERVVSARASAAVAIAADAG